MSEISPRFSAAVEYARAAHAGQYRKGTQVPYVQHPLAVASLVIGYGGDENQAIAALLHDVLEDCGGAHEAAIRDRFGSAVADIVLACTDGSAEAKAQASDPAARLQHWWERKLAYLAALREKSPYQLLVPACDKLHNAQSVVADLARREPGLAVFERFTAGREGTLRYYESVTQVFESHELSPAAQLRETVERMHTLVGETRRRTLDAAA